MDLEFSSADQECCRACSLLLCRHFCHCAFVHLGPSQILQEQGKHSIPLGSPAHRSVLQCGIGPCSSTRGEMTKHCCTACTEMVSHKWNNSPGSKTTAEPAPLRASGQCKNPTKLFPKRQFWRMMSPYGVKRDASKRAKIVTALGKNNTAWPSQ